MVLYIIPHRTTTDGERHESRSGKVGVAGKSIYLAKLCASFLFYVSMFSLRYLAYHKVTGENVASVNTNG